MVSGVTSGQTRSKGSCDLSPSGSSLHEGKVIGAVQTVLCWLSGNDYSLIHPERLTVIIDGELPLGRYRPCQPTLRWDAISPCFNLAIRVDIFKRV